jgi:hypothetical protein
MTRTIKASLLFFFLSLCASAIIVTHHVRLQPPQPAPHELFSVVEKQLAAFRASDYSSAYQYASSEVQQKFTMPQFEAMSRREYGDVVNAQSIEFGRVKVSGLVAVVQVFVCHPSGLMRSFVYSLTAEGDSWKINGVRQTRSAPAGRRAGGLHI